MLQVFGISIEIQLYKNKVPTLETLVCMEYMEKIDQGKSSPLTIVYCMNILLRKNLVYRVKIQK